MTARSECESSCCAAQSGAAPVESDERRVMHYISGPMSGYPDCNRGAFDAAAKLLRERGYEVCNPTEFDEEQGRPWAEYLRSDIRALMDCYGVITLPGWQESRGASLEVGIAHALGMRVLPLSMALTMRGGV